MGERGTSTQRSILDAALDVFAVHGFHEAHVELITEAAGCSRPAFYQYFSSKEDVFWRLARTLAGELRAVVERLEALTPDPDGVAALERWLGALIELHQQYRPVFASFREAFREDGTREALPNTITTHLRDLLALHAVFATEPDPGLDLDALAEATTATILRSIHYWLATLGRAPQERFIRGVASTVHRVVFGTIHDVNIGPLVETPAPQITKWATEATSNGHPMAGRGRLTRRRLIDAGGRVLAVRGYHETRIDDIVAEADLSHGSFYRYFANKDELFDVLAIDAVEHMAALIDAFPPHPDAALGDWLTQWFETYRSKGGVLSAWEGIGTDVADARQRSTQMIAMILDRLEHLVRRRGFGDVAVDALVLLAVIEHGPHSVLVLDRLDEPRAIATVGHIIRRGVLGRI